MHKIFIFICHIGLIVQYAKGPNITYLGIKCDVWTGYGIPVLVTGVRHRKPFEQEYFHRALNSMGNLFCSHRNSNKSIAKTFYTWYDSSGAVAYAMEIRCYCYSNLMHTRKYIRRLDLRIINGFVDEVTRC